MGTMSGEIKCEECGHPHAWQVLSNSLDWQTIECPQCRKKYTYTREWKLSQKSDWTMEGIENATS